MDFVGSTAALSACMQEHTLHFEPEQRAAWDALLAGAAWRSMMQRLLPVGGRLCCAAALNAMRDAAQPLCTAPLPKDWAGECYALLLKRAFPERSMEGHNMDYWPAADFSLASLQALLWWERTLVVPDKFWDFAFLTPEELETSEHQVEYENFRAQWQREYLYEMLRLCDELNHFTTLAHVAGVHHIAMMAGRGLRQAGCPVDLAVVSAAAAIHDIGKFGCRSGENVPYLHYYYTAKWCDRAGLPTIGHIAANHSTWDLELESLPAESLCLIYADFRSKDKRIDGKNVAVIYTLRESFDVILSKLDNVNDAKRRRYTIVYDRLHDFEEFLRAAAVDVDDTGDAKRRVTRDICLQDADELVGTLVFRGLRFDLDIMHELTAETGFTNLLEAAHTEKNWKHLRAYLEILREYSTYLSNAQKIRLIDFLYEMLIHREGHIRHEAANVLGLTLANFRAGYRKQLPADVEDDAQREQRELWARTLDKIVHPSHRLDRQSVSRIGYTLKLIMAALLTHADPADYPDFLAPLLAYFDPSQDYDEAAAFLLLDTMGELPLARLPAEGLHTMTEFAARYYEQPAPDLRIAAARYLYRLSGVVKRGTPLYDRAVELVRLPQQEGKGVDLYLKYATAASLGLADLDAIWTGAQSRTLEEAFFDDLKVGTPWINIAANIRLLGMLAKQAAPEQALHIATHLCNLIKVSEYIGVRKQAGQTLLEIAPRLAAEQQNEVVVELLKALETGDYTLSKYIPQYLGQLTLLLPTALLEEAIATLRTDLSGRDEGVVNVALDTVGVMLAYSGRLGQDAAPLRHTMTGILLTGVCHFNPNVRQNALHQLGQLFAAPELDDAAKVELLALSMEKLLLLLESADRDNDDLFRYYATAALMHIWRFISVYKTDHGEVRLDRYERVAFFPGTFDPFTLSHKAIVQEIAAMGYEVYLAVDEFSWSKNSLPPLQRARIVKMSTAELHHIHLMPDSLCVNLANPADLQRLNRVFAGREVAVVVGDDVVSNASAYRAPYRPGCIAEQNHIVFRRRGKNLAEVEDACRIITGKILHLELPPHLEEISSSRIRENVDADLDISNMTDPLVQEYIYRQGLYLREPRFKPLQSNCAIEFMKLETPTLPQTETVAADLYFDESAQRSFVDNVFRQGQGLLLLREWDSGDTLCGCLRYRMVETARLSEAIGDITLADAVRSAVLGRVLVLEEPELVPGQPFVDAPHILLAECLMHGISGDCCSAVLQLKAPQKQSALREQLELFGFMPLDAQYPDLYLVDLRHPLVLMQNLEETVKEPFRGDAALSAAIARLRRKMQRTMAGLYPGQLCVTLSVPLVLQQLMDRITAQNGVPCYPTEPRVLGPAMCVPFGKILRGRLVPNTVTKTLHTDRVFTPDLTSSEIDPFPGYPSLESQLRIIRSFDRPVVLVDDLLDREGRLQWLLPLLKAEQIEIRQVLVGLITDYGRDRVRGKEIPVDGIYHIPSLRQCFLESSLYPFIGGDSVQSSASPIPGMGASINRIYPYAAPKLPGCDRGKAVEFSRCVLECAQEFFLTLEQLYKTEYGRSLTLSHLSEAIVLPLCPDKGACMHYDGEALPSTYLSYELTALHRGYEL